MSRVVTRRALWESRHVQSCGRRYSKSADACSATNDTNVIPKMPPSDYVPPSYTGPTAAEILSKRKDFLSPSMFYFHNKPVNIVHGKMQYLFDENGRRYLDAFGGIATVSCGHCHPDVVKAIVKQTQTLQHSTILYLNHVIADFAEALASKLPADLKVVFFTNSGTEANELAMMMARLYTGCHDIISLRNAYHGNASGTMGATAQCIWKFNVVQSGVHHALNPDPYRGPFGSDGEKYAKDVDDLIQFGTSGHVAAFISEAIQGVGGIIELAPGYLPAVYSSIRKAGGLCIADEVQSGFARTGSHFWGFENQGVVPDIVTMAKGPYPVHPCRMHAVRFGFCFDFYGCVHGGTVPSAPLPDARRVHLAGSLTGYGPSMDGTDFYTDKGIGNGIPLGAVVTNPKIAEVLTRRSYFNTFGGNPVCTAAGLAVLGVIDRENLQENSHVVGSYLKERLNSLKEKHDIIGDVRGRGLMVGVELVTDRQLKTPAKVEILQVMDQMKDMGVLIGKGGILGNVFRITPPLCFSHEDADFLVDVMDHAMAKL
ncbi:hypothetical protein OROMI_011804 [Orobanche minor]